MRLSDLIEAIRPISSGGMGDPEITNVSRDSRRVSTGSLYVAVPGLKIDGDAFIPDAIAHGASAVVAETSQAACPVPWLQVANARQTLGLLASAVHGIDCDTFTLVGITGTNGKTTVAHLFHQLFAGRFGAQQSWMFGTVAYVLGTSRIDAPNTTPEAADIFAHMAAASSRPRAVAMEVSSHALALDRVAGLSYDLAVFTNLTQDHLDFHESMESYYLAKKRLFSSHLKDNATAVINIDDPYGRRLAAELAGTRVVTVGTSADASFRITGSTCTWAGVVVEALCGNAALRFSAPLPGRFNVQNVSAMAAGALALGYSPDEISRCLNTMRTVPGRMDRVAVDTPFAVVVDYAHTPDALVNVLTTSRDLTEGRVICVFGCGGDRDPKKRPLMGEAVAANSDEAVVTSDNPRTEDPRKVIDDILPGIPLDFPHHVIQDRREAIAKALGMARAGDCVVVAGKGHETYQDIAGVKHHFDDREVVVELVTGAEGIHSHG